MAHNVNQQVSWNVANKAAVYFSPLTLRLLSGKICTVTCTSYRVVQFTETKMLFRGGYRRPIALAARSIFDLKPRRGWRGRRSGRSHPMSPSDSLVVVCGLHVNSCPPPMSALPRCPAQVLVVNEFWRYYASSRKDDQHDSDKSNE